MKHDEVATRDVKIVAAYKGGRTLASIAEQFFLTPPAVLKALRRNGVPRQYDVREKRNPPAISTKGMNRAKDEHYDIQRRLAEIAANPYLDDTTRALLIEHTPVMIRARLQRQWAMEDALEALEKRQTGKVKSHASVDGSKIKAL